MSLLVMLDSLLPSGMQKSHFEWIYSQTTQMMQHGVGTMVSKLKAKLDVRKEKRIRQSQKISYQDGKIPDQRLMVYADAVNRFETTEAASEYGGRTLLIRARDTERFPGYSILPDFGWKKHLTGNFYIEDAPGDHLGLLKSPNVTVTADIIKRALYSEKHIRS